MMDGLSWNDLAAKESRRKQVPWVTSAGSHRLNLRTAMAVAKEADRLAKQRAKTNGKTTGQPEKSQSDFEG